MVVDVLPAGPRQANVQLLGALALDREFARRQRDDLRTCLAFFLRAAAALPLGSVIVIVIVTVHGVEEQLIVIVTDPPLLVPLPSSNVAGTTVSTSEPHALVLATLSASPL